MPYRSTPPETPLRLSSLRKTNPTNRSAHFPVYVIFSDRQALQRVYGLAATHRIEAAARKLVRAIENRPDWDAMLFFPPSRPAPHNPWDLKLALADLDNTLSARGERIGALLIVGGPEIVPFHMLPNPVDDSDEAVASDNPYATRDENYFVSEWPVGRLPGGSGSDPSLLINSLQRYTEFHTSGPASPDTRHSWLWRWLGNLTQLIRLPTMQWMPGLRPDWVSSYGYTAAVWQRASISVFRPIGQGDRLKVSPPLSIDASGPEDEPQLHLPSARLAYFNLHGQRESAVWYGQSDPTSTAYLAKEEISGKSNRKRPTQKNDRPENQASHPLVHQDFPVALRPVDIYPGLSKNGHGWWQHLLASLSENESANGAKQNTVPGIVFSEACFGAHIDDRSVEQAISLTFLRAGSCAFVGSTCIAYGAIGMPLTAADLLGHTFWQYLMDGYPAGEALRRAKVSLSTEMDRRQGYLDGEDQKTLISFVLYGDPLYQDAGRSGPGAVIRSPKHTFNLQADDQSLADALNRGLDPEPPAIHTVCDRAEGSQYAAANEGEIPPDVLVNVRQIVSKYLPGMAGASMKLAAERAACKAHGHTCPTAHLGAKGLAPESMTPNRRVITLSKSITCPVSEAHESRGGSPTITHQQYARLTLDASAKIVKLVVSR